MFYFNEQPLWQTLAWEDFEKSLGFKTFRIQGHLMVAFPLFFEKKYGYFQRGPVIISAKELETFKEELDRIAKKENLIFYRMDPEKPLPTQITKIKTSFSVQPETTLILDLRLSEEELLKQMKRKGRYNIALAERKGVQVKKATSPQEKKDLVRIFFQLLKVTAKRNDFFSHDEHFYQKMLEIVPFAKIFIAYYHSEPLAGGIFCFQKERALYYYGASSNHHRELMAPYLLQWEAIKEAKKRGCLSYDFLGIAPHDAKKNHPWQGITEFKKKFGGTVIRFPIPQDIIYQPFWYKVYRLLKFFQKLKNKFFNWKFFDFPFKI